MQAFEVLAQPTSISGTINSYTRVVEFDDCGGSAVVEDDMDLVQNNRVLIIAMTGAFYYGGNDKYFGTVQEYSSSGLFEFATVESVVAEGSHYRVTFEHPTLNSYQAAPGALQLIKVPKYVDVTVTGDLTAQAWDGETGGVLVFEATGTLLLNDDIDVNGKGFAGGEVSTNGVAVDTSLYGYIYPTTGGRGGVRGGGIGLAPSDNAGRGPLVNGGGGGNSQNAGGGGGGNAGSGGRGGNQTYFSNGGTKRAIGGVGGRALLYSPAPFQRIFMGGGGGGGHQDGGGAGEGGQGGGIVIIRAAQIDGNGKKILANGSNGEASTGDAGGGGGAGGVVLLSIPSFDDDGVAPPDLNIEVKGGMGGHAFWCHGPGGGGGGGFVGFSATALYAAPKVDLKVDGGMHGSVISCSLDEPPNNGALDGMVGTAMYSLVLPGDPLP